MQNFRAVVSSAFALALAAVFCGCASRRDSSPEIYDTVADGEREVAEALRIAQMENKRVLIDLGANWCSDSQSMFQLLTTNAAIRRVIQDQYVFVMVDVNKQGFKARNSEMVKRLGNPIAAGIPVLLVLDANGALLNTDPDERLADVDHERPAIVLAYLRKWAAR